MEYFKVSALGLDQPTTVTIAGHPSPNERYPGNFNLPIVHNGTQKTWTVSGYVMDKINNIGCNQGVSLQVALRYNDKSGKNYTDVAPAGDITMQPQNNPQPSPQAPQAEQCIDTQERILRGMCFNNASTILSGKDVGTEVVKDLTLRLYKEMKPWLTGEEEKKDEVPLPEYTGDADTIDINDIPF